MPTHSTPTYYPPSSYNVRYTFSAKEKDVETGYSYFGARYYNSALPIWLSIDPMAGKYPSMSPYVYCANNPIKLVDPNGKEWEVNESGHIREVGDKNNLKLYAVKGNGQNDFGERKTVGIGKNKMEVSIDVDENIMQQTSTLDANGTVKSTSLDASENDETARNVLRFVSVNTDVEWSYWGGKKNGDNSAFISTSHKKTTDNFSPKQAMSFINSGGVLVFYIHTHPKSESFGAFTNNIDRNFQNKCRSNNANIVFGIMHRGTLFNMQAFKMNWDGSRK